MGNEAFVHVTESQPQLWGLRGILIVDTSLGDQGISGVPVTQQENGMLPGKGQ